MVSPKRNDETQDAYVIRLIREEEREACAVIADTIDKQDEIDNGIAMTGAAGQVASAIRDRK